MASRPPVSPYLTVSPAAAAIAFYTTVFEAKQKALMPSLDGVRIAPCELEINGGAVMLADPFPEFAKTRVPMPGDFATVSISLEYGQPGKVDEVLERALKLGATSEMQPTNSLWGTRLAILRDPFGHRWMISAPSENGLGDVAKSFMKFWGL